MSAPPSGDIASPAMILAVARSVTDPVSYGRPPDVPLDIGPPPLLRTGDVSALYRIPAGTVHRWACEDAWTKYGTRSDRRWSLDDVQASYDRRNRADAGPG